MAKAKRRCKQYRRDTSLCYDVVCMICDGDGGLLASFSERCGDSGRLGYKLTACLVKFEATFDFRRAGRVS